MRLIIIVVALVIALFAAFAISGVFKEKEDAKVLQTAQIAPVQKVQETQIYVARKDIQIGTSVTAADFESKAWPSNLMPPGAILAGSQVDKQITSAPILAGEPLMTSKLRNPNDPSFIAGQLGEGMRAVTISVSLTDSVAGFVSPGDMVDVIFSFDLNKAAVDTADLKSTSGGTQADRVAVTEVMLPNVKVLAVDKRVTAGNTVDAEGRSQEPPVPASVTLAVNQRDAQRLKLAEKVGKVTLTIRSLADANKFERVRPSIEQDLTRLMPPAYFPVLFDSNAEYDYNVVDLYNAKNPEPTEDALGKEEDKKSQVNIYRGSQLQTMEVNRK